MTTVLFRPTATAVFAFQAVLDGVPYTATVPWVTWAQRWYLRLADQNGNLVLFRALVGSPAAIPIASASWSKRTATITTQKPHGFVPRTTRNVTVSGLTPAGYNGQAFVRVADPLTLTYPLAPPPGAAAAVVSGMSVVQPFAASLLQGYFASAMYYNEELGAFTVLP